MNSWKNYFCQLLNVLGISDVGQTEMCTSEPTLAEPSFFHIEIAIEKLTRCKSTGIHQIPAELIQAGDKYIMF
jgi:hypothetical protein